MTAQAITVSNPFGAGASPATSVPTAQATDSARAVAEVQAALVVARMNPRNPLKSMDRILNACTRQGLAESAMYNYRRGSAEVYGPSIRLAEVLAQEWGNVSYGIRELSSANGSSEVQAYAWDLETNTRREVTFTVPHIRYTRKGSSRLEDPRDIYELVANQGSRRVRACILAVIPGDVTEAALSQCQATIESHIDVTPEGIKKMVAAFKEHFGVTQEQIEKFCQRRVDTIRAAQMVRLRSIFTSLKDGMATVTDFFEPVEAAKAEAKKAAKPSLKDKLKAQEKEQQPQPLPAPVAQPQVVPAAPAVAAKPATPVKVKEPVKAAPAPKELL